MWEMTHVCGKWFKYSRNGYNMWEMTQICGKRLKYVTKWRKYLTNGLIIGK